MPFGGIWTAVIVTQVALSVALLPTAISETLEANRFQTAPDGFPARDYVAARIETDSERPFSATCEELTRRLMDEASVPGVTFADRLPGVDHPRRAIEVDDVPAPERARGSHGVHVASVDVRFFDALSVPILAGRPFHSGDLTSDHGVVIVNQSFVRLVLGDRNRIGRRVRYTGGDGACSRSYEIVGVVRDLGMNPMNPEDAAGLYHAVAPGGVQPIRVAVRVGGDTASFAARLRSIATDVERCGYMRSCRSMRFAGASRWDTA
jgi:putative ABC transport system permease protein